MMMSKTPSTHCTQSARRRGLAALAIAALAISLTACGTNGRTMEEPKPGATAPARNNAGSTVPGNTNATVDSTSSPQIRSTAFTLTTSAWKTGESIPKPFTCDGVDTSPPFAINGVPAGTTELVFVASSQSDLNQTLWLLAGIGPATVSIPQGGVPTGAIQITNSSGTPRWSGPCPPSGANGYEFALYALASPSGLTTSSTLADVNAAIAKSTSASVISGTYSR